MDIYLVGGAVRDKLLNQDNQDLDYVVVGETRESMIESGFKPIEAVDFPIFIKDNNEYALARKEKKSGKGYKGFEVTSSPDILLEDDLYRRDLTINSIAEDSEGNLIDPYNGVADIKNKVIRHTSTAFLEDPVRLLRAARFMAQLDDFFIADETLRLMKKMVSNGEIDHLTPERVWKETEKALKTKNPVVYFETLRSCGALKVLFPEVDALFGVPQPSAHHPEIDTGIHTFMALREAKKLTDDSTVLFAVLVHDLGKGITDKSLLPSHYGHEEAGIPLVENLCDRLKTPNNYKRLALQVTEFHTKCHKAVEMKPGKLVGLFEKLGVMKNGSEEHLNNFVTACEADAKGRLGFEDRDYIETDLVKTVYKDVLAMDTKWITERYKGKGATIGKQIKQERVRAAINSKYLYLQDKNAEEDSNPTLR